MKLSTKAAGVLLAATAVCGIGSAAANAATPAASAHSATAEHKVKSPMLSNGFHVYNLSSHPIRLVSVSGENSWEGRAPDGSILYPGAGYQDFEMTWYWFRDTFDQLNYEMLGDNGNVIATFHYNLGSGGAERSDTSSSFTVDSGNIAGDAKGQTMDVKDAGRPNITLNGDQAQAQANVLRQLCADGNSANCSFELKDEHPVLADEHQVGDAWTNPTKLMTHYELDVSESRGVTDSVGVEVQAGTNLFGLIDAQVNANYHHDVTTTRDFAEKASVDVPGQNKIWMTLREPVIRDTGNFTVTLGNTTWHLNNVYFDSPNPSGNGEWVLYDKDLTTGETSSYPVS